MKKSLRYWLAIVITLLAITFQACHHTDPAPKVQPPTIESFTPDAAPVGTTVIITGTNFSTDATNNVVSFNATAATVTNATETQLTVTVPAGATTGKLTVVVNGNTATSASNFTVTTTPPNQQPTLTGFSPSSGLVGIEVTITGTNFSTTAASNVVKFNGTAATVTAATATQLTVTVPAGATSGKITVGATSSSTDFTIISPPTVTSFVPSGGIIGTTVIITGTNFDAMAANNVVKFNSTQATITNATATALTVTIPLGATSGKISITTNNLTIVSSADFVVGSTYEMPFEQLTSQSTVTNTVFNQSAHGFSLGYEFTSASDGLVVSLGCASPRQGSFTVQLYQVGPNNTGTLLATSDPVTITQSDLAAYTFKYVDLKTKVTISKGVSYRVAYSVKATDGFYATNLSVPVANANVTITGGFYGTSIDVYPNNSIAAVYPADVKILFP